jgi:hypothetical protein
MQINNKERLTLFTAIAAVLIPAALLAVILFIF